MPNYTFFGLAIPVGGDVAATAIENPQNPNILDAAAGHIFQTATATSNDDVWLVAGLKFVSNSNYWILTNNSSASAFQLRADGLVRYWLMTSASAGATVTPTNQAPVFYVSPSGAASFTGWYTTTGSSIVLGPATPSATVSDGYVYVPVMTATPTGTPSAQPGHVAVAATSATFWLALPGTSIWTQAGQSQTSVKSHFYGSGNFTATKNYLWGGSAAQAENQIQGTVPTACTMKNLYIQASTAPGAGQTYLCNLRKNNANTAVTATVIGTATATSDTTNAVTFAAGDIVSIGVSPSGGTPATFLTFGIEIDPS